MGSVEGCDDQESVCSSNEREGDAFPKAFDRELVTPTNLQKPQATDSNETGTSTAISNDGNKITQNDTKELTIEKTVENARSSAENAEQTETLEVVKELRSLEDRRRSLLDHHWAMPSKER